MTEPAFSVVVAVNDRRILESNLLRSPALSGKRARHQIILREGFSSAALAYNSALDQAQNDLLLFVHQDVYLPEGWFDQVGRCVEYLEVAGSPWGVLGAYGARSVGQQYVGRIYTNGLGYHGAPIVTPQQVDTLDEITLVLRKSSGLRFDPALPHFHMYGVDICLSARARGLVNYAVPAMCVHNTDQIVVLPEEFYRSYWYVKRKWPSLLPIQTSCIRISKFDLELRRRRLREKFNGWVPMVRHRARRVANPASVLEPLEAET
jgi:Glycosyltransferase like family